jgi:hypothetical protein
MNTYWGKFEGAGYRGALRRTTPTNLTPDPKNGTHYDNIYALRLVMPQPVSPLGLRRSSRAKHV